jgi:arsenate reductase-like glutaredoxin family protein
MKVIEQVEVPYEVIKYIETTGSKPDLIDAYTTTHVPTLDV